jgi:hypothetical protein
MCGEGAEKVREGAGKVRRRCGEGAEKVREGAREANKCHKFDISNYCKTYCFRMKFMVFAKKTNET